MLAYSDTHIIRLSASCMLVFFMTIPGIALFYGGLVQQKNALSIYAQCIAVTAISSIVWILLGYSLAFPLGSQFVGFIDNPYWSTIRQIRFHPLQSKEMFFALHVLYQMCFAVITLAIIVGGFAERMKFLATLIFTPIWLLVVYCPIAHWIWGGGWLQRLGVLDFAGGTVVHVNAGIAGLIAALMVGQRKHKHNNPYSISLVTIGASVLWIGWFGFNAGNARTISESIIAFSNTQLAPMGSIVAWMLTEWWHRKKPSARGLLFGMISGLVAITPSSGYCSPALAIVVGIFSGFICYWATNLKKIFGYDDALDVFGIHGVAGIFGALLTAIVANKALYGIGYAIKISFWGQLGLQALSVAATLMWSGCCTFIILWIMQKIMGLRVTQAVELEGLDFHEHGESLNK